MKLPWGCLLGTYVIQILRTVKGFRQVITYSGKKILKLSTINLPSFVIESPTLRLVMVTTWKNSSYGFPKRMKVGPRIVNCSLIKLDSKVVSFLSEVPVSKPISIRKGFLGIADGCK